MFAFLQLEKVQTLACPPAGPIHTEDKCQMWTGVLRAVKDHVLEIISTSAYLINAN